MIAFKVGFGYDVHKFAEGRPLVLGGVIIPHGKGLLGHSDADVLLHAVTDSLLGAAALGDIGKLFPPGDPRYLGANSADLLRTVVALIKENNYRLGNIDSVIIAEEPLLSPYIPKMREVIAEICETDVQNISVKATTEEGLGLAGLGIGAKCVCLLYKE